MNKVTRVVFFFAVFLVMMGLGMSAYSTQRLSRDAYADEAATNVRLFLQRPSWTMMMMDGEDVSAAGYTMVFREGVLTGTICNQLQAKYFLQLNQMEVGMVTSTKKACAPEVMRVEEGIVRMFKSSLMLLNEGGRLSLVNADGEVAMFVAGNEVVEVK